MCECLEHSDGTITLCEVCADTWRESQSDMVRLHDVIDRLNRHISALEKAARKVHAYFYYGDHAGMSRRVRELGEVLAMYDAMKERLIDPDCAECGGDGSMDAGMIKVPCPKCCSGAKAQP